MEFKFAKLKVKIQKFFYTKQPITSTVYFKTNIKINKTTMQNRFRNGEIVQTIFNLILAVHVNEVLKLPNTSLYFAPQFSNQHKFQT